MVSHKLKKCRSNRCDNLFTPTYSTLQVYCSSQCAYENKTQKKKPAKKINRTSKKGAIILRRYTPLRREYLSRPENKGCKINGTRCTLKATTIEHLRGKGTFYVDNIAQENDIPLTLDERYWLPACLNCNLELENNSELSKAFQLSKIHGGKKI